MATKLLDVTTQDVMLCASHKKISEDIPTVFARLGDMFTFQVKLDGMRALAAVDGKSVLLRSRTGEDVSAAYPEVVAALAALDTKAVFDGELCQFGPDGRPVFSAMSWRNSIRNKATVARAATTVPVSYVVFDLLCLGGTDLRQRPLTERLTALEALPLTGTVQQCPSFDDGPALWERVQSLGLEGVVAKRKTSHYAGQRSLDWVKVKQIHRISAIVGDVLASEHRAIGKVVIHVLDGDTLVCLGPVGTGWKAGQLNRLAAQVRAYAEDPVNRDPVVIDVDFTGRYPDGCLQFPSYKGIRTDVAFTSCTIDQPGL